MADDEGLPPGWTIELDPTTRRIDGGRVLVGGAPFRLLRLSAAGADLLDRLLDGAPVPDAPGPRRLARRLVDGSLAHPHPPPGAGPSAAEVSVVIPVRDQAEDLRRTLAALGPVAQVVVVDDGSRDADAVRRAAGSVTVLRHERPRGPGAARNTGWRAATGSVLAFVDADVEAGPGWLPPLLAHLGDPAVAGAAPRVVSSPGQAPAWLAAYEGARSSLDLGPVPALVRPASRVPYVPTAALVVRRAALEACAGFDEALAYGEDVDLVWRLTEAGHQVRYEPAVVVHHPSRPDLRSWLTQRYRYGTSAAALAERHGAAVAPLGTSGWSATAWGATLAGHPVVGTAVAAATTVALVPKLEGLEHPTREAVRIAGPGHLWAGRSVADALWRPWWPVTVLLGWRWRRARPALLAAATVPALLDWRADRPRLGLAAFTALRRLDDLAYGAGVWAGCIRRRSARALLPRFTGRIPRPTPPPADV